MSKRIPNFDNEINAGEHLLVAGVDEVGRGALAGPIVAAAVIFADYPKIKRKTRGVDDSKKLTAKKRIELDALIKKYANDFAIGCVECGEIDRIGIGAANILAFKRALDNLKRCDMALIDGRKFRGFEYKFICLEKGESKSLSIAAASIIAKVYRDKLMEDFHKEFADYDFLSNKGYGSAKHFDALKKLGLTKYHRKSFLKKLENERNALKLF